MSIFKRIQRTIQHLFIALQQVFQYIVKPVTRIFSPTDDQYPTTGVQPFTGEPSDNKRHDDSW
ncbi:MAG: hypothetical protein HC862_17055 [Scytonema sp. RU_4_4]|nr:hypothetical protein [Scytonema sp. RU_4_4]NJR72857.1 hypothetical protein [Scytonema sp. CRU_2_7]